MNKVPPGVSKPVLVTYATKHLPPDKFVWGELESQVIDDLNTESGDMYNQLWHVPEKRKEIVTKFWTRRGVVVDESV